MISVSGDQVLKVKLAAPVTSKELTVVVSFAEVSKPPKPSEDLEDSVTLQTKGTQYSDILESSEIFSKTRNIQSISIKNADTVSADIFIDLFKGATPIGICAWTISPGDTIFYEKGEGWKTIDKNGALKSSQIITTVNDITQVKNTYTAGEILGGHRIVMINGGQAFYFDETDENNIGKQLGMTNNAAILGDPVDVVSEGVVTGFGGILVPDAVYWLGPAGTITTTPPTTDIDFRVGVAIDTDSMKLEMSEPIFLT